MPKGIPRTMDPEGYRKLDRERAKAKAEKAEKVRVLPDRKGSKGPHALPEPIKSERIAFWLDGMRQCKPMEKLAQEFADRFFPDSKDRRTLARDYKREALKYLEENLDKSAGRFRAEQMDRLEDLYRRALERENYKVALSIIDTMNKLMGLYKADQILVQPVTQFNFGDENISAMPAIPTLVVPENYVPLPEPEVEEPEFEEGEKAVKYLTDSDDGEDVGF